MSMTKALKLSKTTSSVASLTRKFCLIFWAMQKPTAPWNKLLHTLHRRNRARRPEQRWVTVPRQSASLRHTAKGPSSLFTLMLQVSVGLVVLLSMAKQMTGTLGQNCVRHGHPHAQSALSKATSRLTAVSAQHALHGAIVTKAHVGVPRIPELKTRRSPTRTS